ncbi:MAG: alkaline phosphatase family protein [Nocardioides sp.]|nr:alkaline phosphatase family protein [Nocardioides sp.]
MLLPRALVAATLSVATSLALAGCAAGDRPAADARLSAAPATATQVLAISVDGLNTAALDRLGADGAPTLHRLLAEGAGTLNARTEYEQTVTLPNHASMMTGRRIAAGKGGHGVTWDDDRPDSTVQQAAGHGVASIFTTVHAAGGSTALYTTKSKFRLYDRSWPRGIDTFRVRESQRRLVRLARVDLADGPPTFTFLHVSLPDRYGHRYGGMSRQYLAAVQRTDAQLGTLLRTLAGTDAVLVLTADHGFVTGRTDHSGRRNIENYRIPFLAWGPGIDSGDLYAMNPDFADPGTSRPSYAGRQPVRNGDLANLAAGLLGLDAVPGSGLDADQSLGVTD